uniref:Uncharacterized protein n=1 Tax=viral metagenome TaxID=1070528 RepID=A0A6C0BD81_9ZZZZ
MIQSDEFENESKIYDRCGINIRAISVEFCTDESRYNEPDSHFIQIPEKMFNKFLSKKDISKPLYIGIRNTKDESKCLYFGRVEPSIETSNSSSNMCLLPGWVMDRLIIDRYGDYVDIVLLSDGISIKTLDYIKIRGNVSSYVKWSNIKEKFEDKLSSYNCVNLNDVLYIDDIMFTIVELKDIYGNNLLYGSTFQGEVKLDFDLPDDLREKEKIELKKLEDERIRRTVENKQKNGFDEKIELKKRSNIMTFSDLENLKDKKEENKNIEYFKGTGNKLTDENIVIKKITREERALLLEERFKKMKEEK